jgi:hypothetical protein
MDTDKANSAIQVYLLKQDLEFWRFVSANNIRVYPCPSVVKLK